MKAAARISSEFSLDPVDVLNDDRWNTLIRSAAYAVIQNDREKAAEQARRKKR